MIHSLKKLVMIYLINNYKTNYEINIESERIILK